jgi:hypothetical protein
VHLGVGLFFFILPKLLRFELSLHLGYQLSYFLWRLFLGFDPTHAFGVVGFTVGLFAAWDENGLTVLGG